MAPRASYLALDGATLQVAAHGFGLSAREVALLQMAAPGEALILSAGERAFVEIVATDQERQLASTTPAELATRNRRRRLSAEASDDVAPGPRRRAVHSGKQSVQANPPAGTHPDLGGPISLTARRGRP